MDELGIVEYDQNRGVVTLLDISEAEPYLAIESDSDSASWPYFVIALCGLVVVGALGLGPLSAVPTAAWTGVSVVALLGIAFSHL